MPSPPLQTFERWSHIHQVHAPHIAIRKTPHAGYGLFCEAAMPADAPLVTIPSTLVLTADRARQDRSDLADIDDDRTALRLFLALEKASSTTAFWKPYFAILPAHDNIQLAQLEGTCLQHATEAKHSALEQQYETLQSAFGDTLTLDNWIWADRMVRSRAVSDAWMLVPFLDFANHANQPNARWELQADGSMHIVPLDETTTIAAGDEIVFSYGAKSNMELLFSYGFTVDANPVRSSVRISATGFLDDPAKIAWMRQLRIPPSLTLNGDNDDEMGWSSESVHLMYLVAMNQQEDGLTLEPQKDGTIDARLDGERVDDLQDLARRAKKLHQHPVLLLRIAMLLLDATQYHYEAIEDAISRIEASETIERYRSEERRLLQTTMEKLIYLRGSLAQDKVVLDYLAAQPEEDEN